MIYNTTLGVQKMPFRSTEKETLSPCLLQSAEYHCY